MKFTEIVNKLTGISCPRVEVPVVPEWCNHWPKSLEQSASFAWENEFNF